LRLIQWLRETAHCPWDAYALAEEAIRWNALPLLQYMQQQGAGSVLEKDDLDGLLAWAGTLEDRCWPMGGCQKRDMAILQWLRDAGASFDAGLDYVELDEDDNVVSEGNWTKDAIAWAQAHGFTGQISTEGDAAANGADH
jgi:hypothetical protein